MWEVMIRGSDVGNAHPRVLLLLSKAKEALKEEREMLKQPLWEHWKSGNLGLGISFCLTNPHSCWRLSISRKGEVWLSDSHDQP